MRAEDAGIARHEDAADVELARQPRRVQRPGAAEGHQRVVARIVAALHADDPDRPRHVGGDDREDALRRRHHVRGRARAASRAIAALARSWRIGMRPPSRCVGFSVCSTTLASVTVGSVVAAVVADRARIGAGAARPDLQQAAAVDMGDRAAAGADGVDVEHRRLDRIAVHDRLAGEPALRRSAAARRRCEVPPMSKVMRSGKPAMRADRLRADDAGATGRTARCAPAVVPPPSKPMTPPFDCVRCGVAVRPSSRQPLRQPSDVALHDRAEIGVHHGRRDPLVLAELRRDLVAGADEGLGQLLREDAPRRVSSCSGRTKP